MVTRSSLEELLQSLIKTAESEKSALLHALVKSLREACNTIALSSSPKVKNQAESAKSTLDRVLATTYSYVESNEDEEWEEEFAESSGDFDLEEGPGETFTASSRMISNLVEEANSAGGQLNQITNGWNRSMLPWMSLPSVNLQKPQDVIKFSKAAAALRSNLSCYTGNESTEYEDKFDQLWKKIIIALEEYGYQVTPQQFGPMARPVGKEIYTCRNRITVSENVLIVPGLSYQGNSLSTPATLVILPVDTEYPADHPSASLTPHWRGVFGELELLAQHVEIQTNAHSAIEGINKNQVDELTGETLTSVLNEIKRRAEVLRGTIAKDDETIYRLATDYWRVEECFWSIFHDDKRVSYFDRLRNNLQGWRTTIRRSLKFNIRDFSCESDTLASVNKYIGNIILRPQQGTAPGTVIRELRPAILVKVQATSRLLKGRAIAT